MQVIVAPEHLEVDVKRGVVIVRIEENSTLEIFFGASDQKEVEKVLNAIFEIKAKELGLDE